MRASGPPVSVVVPLPPSYRGGTEEYAYRLAQRFTATHPVQVFTTNVRWEPDAPAVEVSGATVRRLPAREVCERPLLLSPRSRHQLWRAIRRSSILQLHMPFPFVEGPAMKAAHRAGVPTVLTYHMDADLAGARGGRVSDAITYAYRGLSAHPALRAADAVVSNSWGYARNSPVLSKHLGKVHVIHKGVDVARLGLGEPLTTERPRPPSVPAGSAPDGRPRLLFVGRLVPYKGLSFLFDAMRLLADASEHFGLYIAGRGPMADELRAIAQRLGITDQVTFLGFVPDSELGPLYRFADVVVAPSVGALESTATALEEAAMCGTPIVGSDLPGASETVPNDGRRGILVPPGDPASLARAIVRMVEAGRPSVPMALRTWDDTAREYLDLFRELGAFVPPPPFSPLGEPFAPGVPSLPPELPRWPAAAGSGLRPIRSVRGAAGHGRLQSIFRRRRDPPQAP
jgi:glycosyltransferase involved in cell wall biosynthesis